jgi:hypothetical protein
MSTIEDHLRHFQDYGDRSSLELFIRASGLDLEKYLPALDSLAPVLAAVAFGEHPNYERINKAALEQRPSEVKQILTWMSASDKANMRAAAIGLMRMLGY